MSDVDPNHWTSWTDTPPPCSHSEPGVAEAMALARAEVSERLSATPKPCLFCEVVAGPAPVAPPWYSGKASAP